MGRAAPAVSSGGVRRECSSRPGSMPAPSSSTASDQVKPAARRRACSGASEASATRSAQTLTAPSAPRLRAAASRAFVTRFLTARSSSLDARALSGDGRPQAEPRRRTGLGSSCFSGRGTLFEDRLQRHRLQRSGEDRSVIPAKGLLASSRAACSARSSSSRAPSRACPPWTRGGATAPRRGAPGSTRCGGHGLLRARRAPRARSCKLEGSAVAPPRGSAAARARLFRLRRFGSLATGTRDQSPAGARMTTRSSGALEAAAPPGAAACRQRAIALRVGWTSASSSPCPGSLSGIQPRRTRPRRPAVSSQAPETPFGDLSGGEQELCQGMQG